MTVKSALFALLALASCTWGDSKSHVTSAEARLKGAPGTEVRGTVTFTEVEGGVEVVAKISGLQPGKHGFHIHEKGDCTASDFNSAGGHYNPTNEPHASPDVDRRHIGDLGNLIADEQGIAHYHRVDNRLELNGKHSIIGKGLIVHLKEDDFVTQPTGNAGARVACAVIEANN
ncbi:MAG: superoxide dismutase family protein [Chlamydiia bacterium]|nr:superoxide dismutase family protein [Chlamydiia bacterium]